MSQISRAPQDTDLHIGRALRRRRIMVGMTQIALATAVGVGAQQIAKWEAAEVRISASRLWRLAEALDVPIDHFFVGLDRAEEVRRGLERSAAIRGTA